MPAGRPRKPTENLKLTGNYRSDRRFADEPVPTVEIPDMPDFLTGEAEIEWKRLTPLLAAKRCLTKWDMPMLAAYCYEWGEYVEICKLQISGEVEEDQKMPSATARTKVLKNFSEIAREFGLTPSSRTRLSVSEADTKNPFAALRNQNAG